MNCKPGDLAIIVPPSKNAGAIVEVIGLPKSAHITGMPSWSVQVSGRKLLALKSDGRIYLVTGARAKIPDAWLRPVSGLPIEDEVTDEVTA